ncbi:MAG: PhnD/SsuA/transferrin family substrate-binding protein [Aliishimia sp.]
MIAHFGMYDMPALHGANNRFWKAIRTELGVGPDHLTRTDDPWAVWKSDDLLISQTCGYPYRAKLHGHVQLVATPDYGLPDCPAGYYNSVLIARLDSNITKLGDMSGKRFAYNEALSQSGWAAPIMHLEAQGITPSSLLETGGHAVSAQAVADGLADIAGIDALTWTLLEEHAPDLTASLMVVDRTRATPALPFITALGRDADAIRSAMAQAVEKLSSADRAALHLKGVREIAAEEYLSIGKPKSPQDLLP